MRYASWIVTMTFLSLAALMTMTVLSLAACSGSTSPYGGMNDGGGGTVTGGGGTGAVITVGNDFFSPAQATVSAGDVTFRWATPSNGHTLTWDRGPGPLPANTGTITSGSIVVTLQPGTYDYHCSIHGGPGTGMHGRIVVQ